MAYTIIDSDDYVASGIETMFFPGGEPHVKVPKFEGNVLFIAKCRTWNDTGFAALVVDALGRQRLKQLKIFLPYAPGGRQDRSDGSCGLTASLIGRIFDHPLTKLHTFDIHSIDAYLRFGGPIRWDLTALDVPIRPDVVGIIAPDKGAVSRAESFRDKFYPDAYLLECSKARDPQTGALSHYLMPKPPRQGHYIVVDDICDGGGTFNLLADAFRGHVGPDATDYSLELVVSHGIFSKGIDAISPVYSQVITTNSWFAWDRTHTMTAPRAQRLTVLPLNQLFDTIMGESN